MKQFKIRASACGNIMSGTIGLTDPQKSELQKLNDKLDSGKSLTDLQEKKMRDLIHKKMNPELPQGAKTYCETWLKEQLYSQRKEFTSKYTDKGNENEDESLDFIGKHLGLGMLIKNEERFSNEFMEGEPDALPKGAVIDAKNSWDCFTFPLYDTKIENSLYDWQLDVYMILTNRKKAILAYTLTDTPLNLIINEANRYSYRNGEGEASEELIKEFIEKMTFNHIPDDLRIKIFEKDYDDSKRVEIETRVKLCRKYIDELLISLDRQPIHEI